jgi:arabinofuranan 3-O-arabinosyltransferase
VAVEPTSVTARLRQSSLRDWWTVALSAALIYLPLLLTAPGKVGADTKTYLYLDPGRLLADAPYIWHDRIGLGTVTHQNIGYLFPIGPFYWIAETIGLPDWFAQRLWLGSILFGAALGVRYLLRTLEPARKWPNSAVLVAMLAYALSPYVLAYTARISVILLPWAALPWLIALTARSVRFGGWRYPAWFAFVVLVVGGINATALILVGVGPLAWMVYAVAVEREATVRQALAAAVRIGALTLATSLWWIAGLFIQGTHGLPVIRYTETFRTVSEASTAPEVLRGLGYWFFYGSDKLGPWIEPSVTFTTNLPALALSFALPLAGLAALVVVRWRHRGIFAVMAALGGLIAVGGHPWEEGSWLGQWFTTFTRSDAGLALRSTPRAVPLVALTMAVLLASGVAAIGTALERSRPRLAGFAAGIVVIAIVANMSPLWSGQMVADNLQRDEEIPSWWEDAVAAVDAGDKRYRVLEVPGTDFASYRWGNTVDPVTPGLTDRPWAARELFQYGSAQSANLLNAIDRRFHEDTLDPSAVAPVARLMGVSEILVRSDLQYERYRIARPRLLWDQLLGAPGLGTPIGFGPTTPNIADPSQPLVDEIELATDPALANPPAVALVPVDDPVPVLRTVTARNPMVLSGDGEGVVDAAGAGLLSANQLLLYSAWASSTGGDPALIEDALGRGADLVVTDTNRRRAARWGTLRENNGYTEFAGEESLRYDPTDQRLDVFPGSGDDTRTVTVVRPRDGAIAASARATAWGNPITLTPDDRPMAALDGDPTTAWRVGAIDDPVGERLVIDLTAPVTTDRLTLLQPTTLSRNRWITEARIFLRNGDGPTTTVTAPLTDASRDPQAGGEVITFPATTFDHVEIEVVATNVGPRIRYDGQSSVGFAEVGIDGVATIELVRPPTDLLDAVGADSLAHRLIYLFSRLRSNPAEPVRGDPETAVRRLVTVPAGRSFSVAGEARISAFLPDERIDELLGLPAASAGGVTARSSERLPGSVLHRASAALDGDPTTFWLSPFEQRGEVWLDYTFASPTTLDSADLVVLTDGRHSVPTRVRVEARQADGTMSTVTVVGLPEVADSTEPNAVTRLAVPFPGPVTTTELRVVVEEMRQMTTKDWYSNLPVVMPVGVAEVDLAGVQVTAPQGPLDTGCRDDLLTIDDAPVPLRITGTVEDAVARRGLDVTACAEVTLPAGESVLETTDGRTTGFDLDQIRIASDVGGASLAPDALPRQLPEGPAATVDANGRVQTTGTIDGGADGAYWIVQGQSWSDGWVAEVNGETLGTPVLVDGFANGWLVASPGEGAVAFSVTWTPQRVVWAALGISAVAAVITVILGFVGVRRRRDAVHRPDAGQPDLPTPDWVPWSTRPGWWLSGTWVTAGVVGLLATVAAALNLPAGFVWVAPLIGIVGAGALRWGTVRNLPALLAWTALAVAGGFTWIQQYRYRYPSDFDWPASFERAHVVGVVAILAIGLSGVLDLIGRWRRSRSSTPPERSASAGT